MYCSFPVWRYRICLCVGVRLMQSMIRRSNCIRFSAKISSPVGPLFEPPQGPNGCPHPQCGPPVLFVVSPLHLRTRHRSQFHLPESPWTATLSEHERNVWVKLRLQLAERTMVGGQICGPVTLAPGRSSCHNHWGGRRPMDEGGSLAVGSRSLAQSRKNQE